MGDVHGAYKCLLQCLERSGFDYGQDRLIQLGDVVDGYPESYECVEKLLKIPNLVAIRGNHDDWIYEFCKTGYHPARWAYGGIATLKSYFQHCNRKKAIIPSGSGFKTSLNPEDIPAAHKKFFVRQQLYFIDDEGRCFVHGGFDRFHPFAHQRAATYFWDRDLWDAALAWLLKEKLRPGQATFEIRTHFHEIFIGHTPTTYWKLDVPMNAAHIYNCDTGAGSTGRLTIMNVGTKKYWQSDPVQTLYSETPQSTTHNGSASSRLLIAPPLNHPFLP